mmetsp:Transcript_93351/g.261069  ORF Transcript_93351/g.261069 Transcript_93351/m.261069 type:complete len:217 (-) Transcript_93351:503-1153(-)
MRHQTAASTHPQAARWISEAGPPAPSPALTPFSQPLRLALPRLRSHRCASSSPPCGVHGARGCAALELGTPPARPENRWRGGAHQVPCHASTDCSCSAPPAGRSPAAPRSNARRLPSGNRPANRRSRGSVGQSGSPRSHAPSSQNNTQRQYRLRCLQEGTQSRTDWRNPRRQRGPRAGHARSWPADSATSLWSFPVRCHRRRTLRRRYRGWASHHP